MPALTKKFIIAASLVSMLAPVLVSARETITNSPKTTQIGFCTRAASVKTLLSDKLSELESNRGKNRTEVLSELKERQDDRADQIEQKREDSKKELTDKLAELSTLATTNPQKAALTAFKTAITNAMATRKSAVDAARQTYRNAVQALVTKRQDAIKTAATALRTSIAAALAKAQSDCTAGTEHTTVRQTLQASVKAAQEKFHTDMQAIEKNGQQVKALVETRNAAVRAANQAFKTTMEQARKTLKAALSSTTPAPEPISVPAPTPVPTE